MWAKQKQTGFTIVELLIVIVVIAILAAITIVAYNGIQDRAKNAAAQSAASQAAKKLQAYAVLNNDQYPATLADADIQNTDGSLQYTGGGTTFCVTATTQNVSYFQRNTAQTTKGACEGHGKDGVAAVTNMAINPSLETTTANWSVRWYGTGGSGSTQRLADAAYCGTTGYRKTWTVSGTSQDLGYGFMTPGITAGQTYTFSVFTRSSLATAHKAWVSWTDSSGAGISSTFGSSPEITVPANTWRRLTTTQTAPSGAVGANFFFGPYPVSGSPNYTAGATLDADCGMVTIGNAALNYADGETNGWAWSGSRYNSTSSGVPQ